MTTYPQFIAQCQQRQAEYIAAQQETIERAAVLWQQYAAAMAQLGLHPLTRPEIDDRRDVLENMASLVDRTHGDSVAIERIPNFYSSNADALADMKAMAESEAAKAS